MRFTFFKEKYSPISTQHFLCSTDFLPIKISNPSPIIVYTKQETPPKLGSVSNSYILNLSSDLSIAFNDIFVTC